MENLTNEECQVLVHAIKTTAKVVEALSEHVLRHLPEDTFTIYADQFKSGSDFMQRAVYQLEKIQKRLQGE